MIEIWVVNGCILSPEDDPPDESSEDCPICGLPLHMDQGEAYCPVCEAERAAPNDRP